LRKLIIVSDIRVSKLSVDQETFVTRHYPC